LYSGETAQAANREKRPEQIGLYMAAGIQSQHKSFVGNQGGAIMQTLGKIAATLGVIGAIAASCTVPAAAWYGYHHHRHYYHHRYYGYHHRYYAYYARYDRERYYHYAGGGY
jgi:hypothetical protein